MKDYVDVLIDRAVGRPVLQFNRIDFRLPWFRRHYPNATYIHIFRHPRDQWCSMLQSDWKRFSRDATMAEFPPYDRFYLRMWAEDLKYSFPFLAEKRNQHPYQLHYFIWKLSYLFGLKYCDHSIPFEAIRDDAHAQLRTLFQVVGAGPVDLEKLKAIVVEPMSVRWREYADDAWFQAHEAHCEAVLADFLGSWEKPLAATRAARAERASYPVVG